MSRFSRAPSRSVRIAAGIHAIDTEVRSLDQALNIIQKQESIKKQKATKAKHKIPVTRKQLFAAARNEQQLKKWMAKNPPRPKLPHPFRDLSPDQQAAKVREMYDGGAGLWGWGNVAYRRLAKLFGVTVGQIATWIEEETL